MPDIIDFKQGQITYEHLFIFCDFYRHNIQPRVKKTAFLYSFMAWFFKCRNFFIVYDNG